MHFSISCFIYFLDTACLLLAVLSAVVTLTFDITFCFSISSTVEESEKETRYWDIWYVSCDKKGLKFGCPFNQLFSSNVHNLGKILKFVANVGCVQLNQILKEVRS